MQLTGYQLETLQRFAAWRPIKDATILEVGGLWESATAEWLLAQGAREVWVTNPRMDKEFQRKGDVVYASCYAQDIAALTDIKFDAVFGIAVIEHFQKLEPALAEFRKILKLRGQLFLHGGPIWSYATGHHVWVDGTRPYHVGTPSDPLRPWEHILSSEKEVGARLGIAGIPDVDIAAILDFVFKSERLSRYTYADFRRIFIEAPNFARREWIEMHGDARPCNSNVEALLKAKFGQNVYTVQGLAMRWVAV